MDFTPQQEKRIDGILALVKDYLDARFTHARRVNPRISHIYADIMWQQLATLRLILREGKAFGPVKYLVADILCSDDEPKRKALFNPVDQNSIMNEIIDVEEEKRDQKAGTLEIKDIDSTVVDGLKVYEQISCIITAFIGNFHHRAAEMGDQQVDIALSCIHLKLSYIAVCQFAQYPDSLAHRYIFNIICLRRELAAYNGAFS